MKFGRTVVICVTLTLASGTQHANAQGIPGVPQEALNAANDFADKLCRSVPLSTQSSKVELSGAARAELGGLIKKLTDLGIEGAAKYSTESSQNVLQQHLASVLVKNIECKRAVWDDLKASVLSGSGSRGSKVDIYPQNAPRCKRYPGTSNCECRVNPDAGWRGPGVPVCPTNALSGQCTCDTPQGSLPGRVVPE